MRIVVLEDSQDDEAMTLRALKGLPFQAEVVVLRCGKDADEWLQGSNPSLPLDGDPPTLLVTDHRLPGIRAEELLARISAMPELKAMPTIVWSSSMSPQDAEACLCAGATEVVRKPLSFDEYMQTLQSRVAAYFSESSTK